MRKRGSTSPDIWERSDLQREPELETYFINGRYIKNQVVYKAIEDAYKDFSMQHKYPFVVLHIAIDGTAVDVNVHPAKMELRFSNQQEVYNAVFAAVDQTLPQKRADPGCEAGRAGEDPGETCSRGRFL